VELKTNTALGRILPWMLLEEGYKAVFLGIGCHVGKPWGFRRGRRRRYQGVEFLRRANLKEP
jgi:hypothetical protein